MGIRRPAILFLSRLGSLAAALVAKAMLVVGCRASDKPLPPPTSRPDEPNIVITIVYDNNTGRKDLTPAWGFACVVQGLEKTILFDTGGDGRILLENMQRLGLDPAGIDAVVISHIHGDHTGGLSAFLKAGGGVPVHIPSGFPAGFKKEIQSIGGQVVEADEAVTICPGARTTGTLAKGAIEEHGLCVAAREGWVLITGCAHPGVANMAARAKQVTGGGLHLVMGGFHMGFQSRRRIEAVIERFEQMGVERVAPCHCSGRRACELFKEQFAERCVLAKTGEVFRLHRKH
ncbi:MAG: MBL fold metallo-hydrolase [Phycisphaerae bacterium]|nr:MBL fold metallo-hydrolase [Phycisphaerae bacterium]